MINGVIMVFDEHWKPIDGWPYYVSDNGIVARSEPEANTFVGKILTPNKVSESRGGYLYYVLCRDGKTKTFYGHALVAQAFIGPRPSSLHQVRHMDGDVLNNHYLNLAWGAAKDNADDRNRHGMTRKGERCTRAVLTNEEAQQLRKQYEQHLIERKTHGFERVKRGFLSALAHKFGLNLNTMCSILHGKGYIV